MKKIIFIVFALLFAITVFVGCAQQPATDESAQPAAASEAQSSAPSPAAATSENTENSAELPDMEPVELKWAMSYASDHPVQLLRKRFPTKLRKKPTVQLHLTYTWLIPLAQNRKHVENRICWAEGERDRLEDGRREKKQVIKALRDLTPDWLD